MRRGQSSKKVHISFVHVKIYYAFIDEAMKNRLHLLFDLFFIKQKALYFLVVNSLLEITHFRRRGKHTSEQLSIL